MSAADLSPAERARWQPGTTAGPASSGAINSIARRGENLWVVADRSPASLLRLQTLTLRPVLTITISAHNATSKQRVAPIAADAAALASAIIGETWSAQLDDEGYVTASGGGPTPWFRVFLSDQGEALPAPQNWQRGPLQHVDVDQLG